MICKLQLGVAVVVVNEFGGFCYFLGAVGCAFGEKNLGARPGKGLGLFLSFGRASVAFPFNNLQLTKVTSGSRWQLHSSYVTDTSQLMGTTCCKLFDIANNNGTF